jgi:hypothetical protein
MEYDLFKPTLLIKGSKLTKPYDLCKIMKREKIAEYGYGFFVETEEEQFNALKFGMSADNAKSYGDRVYRQLANIYGWGSYPKSQCGKDMIEVVRCFEAETGLTIHKDNVHLGIYDAAPMVNVYKDRVAAAEYVEGQLLTQYEKMFNSLPIGNFKDTRKTGYTNMFSELFDDG